MSNFDGVWDCKVYVLLCYNFPEISITFFKKRGKKMYSYNDYLGYVESDKKKDLLIFIHVAFFSWVYSQETFVLFSL